MARLPLERNGFGSRVAADCTRCYTRRAMPRLPPLSLAATAALGLLSACGTAKPAPTWEADVKPLMAASCVSCHVEGGIAPFALTSYEQVSAMKDAVRLAVESRRMPPYLAGDGCADYADDQRLSPEQVAMLGAWAEAGAPRGGPETPPIAATAVAPSLPRVDLMLEMPTAYTPQASPDDYRCFVVDWPGQADTYVTGFHVKPGNARVVRHVIAFLIQPERVQGVMDLDASEAGPGYTCFGGPGGSNASLGWLGSWAPGVLPSMYPENTGLLVRPGSKVVLQVHYNTSAAPEGQREDRTTVELALADSVQKRAFIMPWANPDWVRQSKMPIPAGEKDVTHQWAMDPTQFLSYLTANQVPNGQGFRVYAAGFHQHLLGTKGRLDIKRADGTRECLLDVPRWDFHWQRSYRLAKTKIFRPGDLLGISCHWDNSAENQPLVGGVPQAPRDVNWGEGTGDEMCLGIFYISE